MTEGPRQKVFTVSAREWAEADKAAVHARNAAAIRYSLAGQGSGVQLVSEAANPDGYSVDLTYEW